MWFEHENNRFHVDPSGAVSVLGNRGFMVPVQPEIAQQVRAMAQQQQARDNAAANIDFSRLGPPKNPQDAARQDIEDARMIYMDALKKLKKRKRDGWVKPKEYKQRVGELKKERDDDIKAIRNARSIGDTTFYDQYRNSLIS